MIAKITKIIKKPSKLGGVFYYLFVKDDKGKSYKTCLYPVYRNFERWRPVIERFIQTEKDVWLDNLIVRGKLLDADSYVRIISNNEALKAS